MANEISIYRGDNADVQAIVHDADDNNVDISLASAITMTVRDIQTLTVQITKTLALATVAITDGANGTMVAYILPADTTSLTPGRFVADFEVTLATKVYSEVFEFEIKQDVSYT